MPNAGNPEYGLRSSAPTGAKWSVDAFAGLWMLDERAQREIGLMVVSVPDSSPDKPWNVYVDESVQSHVIDGSIPQPPYFYSVTAYLATFERWKTFEREWQMALNHFHSPPFHMTDFMARKGDFENLDWDDNKRNDYVELLCVTAAEHTIMGAGCGIFQKDYEAALPEDMRTRWIDPWYFCVYGMLSLVAGAESGLRKVVPRPLYFLFDNKPEFQFKALELFGVFKSATERNERDKDLFGDAAFGSRTRYAPLQAADLLVYVVNRRFKEMALHLPYKMQKPLDRLNRKGNIHVAFPNEQLLRQYVEFLREEHPD